MRLGQQCHGMSGESSTVTIVTIITRRFIKRCNTVQAEEERCKSQWQDSLQRRFIGCDLDVSRYGTFLWSERRSLGLYFVPLSRESFLQI